MQAMRMKKSKKGVTLVELVICCAIIVMLGGACTAVLASGSTIFNQSSRMAGAQLDADVLQTYMINILPSAENIKKTLRDDAKDIAADQGEALFFNDNGEFTIRSNGSDTTIRSITKFTYKVVRAGDSSSTTAKSQFQYEVTFNDGSVYSGGFMMSNITFSAEISGTCSADSPENAVHFNYPAEGA